MPDEDIPAESKPTVVIHASSGSSSNSPVSSQQSETDKLHGLEPKSGHAGQHVLSNPSRDHVVGMILCSYFSRPLPPLFAMLAAFSGADASTGDDSEISLPNDSRAVTPDGAPCPHASTAAASSEMHSTAISTEPHGAEGAQQASNKGDASIFHSMEDAGSCSGQHDASSCPVYHPDASMESDRQDVDMAPEQNSAEQGSSEALQKQNSCGMHDHQACVADEESKVVLHHFGINEPVLMINPDGSKVYVLLSDEQAAKEKADQMRQEREAAAIAAAKAASYWVSLSSPFCSFPMTDIHALQSLISVLLAPNKYHTVLLGPCRHLLMSMIQKFWLQLSKGMQQCARGSHTLAPS